VRRPRAHPGWCGEASHCCMTRPSSGCQSPAAAWNTALWAGVRAGESDLRRGGAQRWVGGGGGGGMRTAGGRRESCIPPAPPSASLAAPPGSPRTWLPPRPPRRQSPPPPGAPGRGVPAGRRRTRPPGWPARGGRAERPPAAGGAVPGRPSPAGAAAGCRRRGRPPRRALRGTRQAGREGRQAAEAAAAAGGQRRRMHGACAGCLTRRSLAGDEQPVGQGAQQRGGRALQHAAQVHQLAIPADLQHLRSERAGGRGQGRRHRQAQGKRAPGHRAAPARPPTVPAAQVGQFASSPPAPRWC
jgi:hypothetical protein